MPDGHHELRPTVVPRTGYDDSTEIATNHHDCDPSTSEAIRDVAVALQKLARTSLSVNIDGETVDVKELLRGVLESELDDQGPTGGSNGHRLGFESSPDARGAPERITLDAVLAEASGRQTPGPRRPSALVSWGRWALPLIILGTATPFIAHSRRIGNQIRPPVVTNNIRYMDSPSLAAGDAALVAAIPLPEDGGENETGAESEASGPAAKLLESAHELAEAGDKSKAGENDDGDPKEATAQPLAHEPATRPPSQQQRKRKAVERCLRQSKRSCVPAVAWLELESFRVQNNRVLYPRIGSSSPEAKICVLDTLSRCKLPDGRYDDLNFKI